MNHNNSIATITTVVRSTGIIDIAVCSARRGWPAVCAGKITAFGRYRQNSIFIEPDAPMPGILLRGRRALIVIFVNANTHTHTPRGDKAVVISIPLIAR